ncbi:DEAD/DEAH box helicase [Nodularia spumigena]|uniref:DEAD/DEAH box helicase n=1 Tax=Nodularia spumigena TaxID=70799 RepID=UPI00232E2286|nr:DEAD/DEAH box helicase [Nodularia spumigena]MDB9303195.1 DEAD/DEAH box helicase [Nodularia spumigena CS-591/12]MDB9317183.1 DEAD/DEAH box helicase [Nodularia spumigena CS-590/01A]MDB9327303.1 DEAD/DEAH box helicase [Nodularia spumigena CS-590/02]MDB9334580.1 DEAD/DEAH box helicase [Nodularia spumigena CS-590/01]
MNFNDLLSKADEETLQQLLGSATFQLLKLLEPNLVHPSKLREILLTLHTPEELLLSKKNRDLLFDLITPQQAKILAVVLEAPANQDPYQALKKIKISGDSESKKYLLNFFEVPIQARNKNLIETPAIIQNPPKYPLFTHQRHAAKKVKNYLSKKPRRVLLHLPTGAGKTRTAMNIIADHLRNNEPTLVIWLAYSEELCEQAVTEFQKAWDCLGDRTISTYRFWGSHDLDLEQAEDGFIVAGLAKVYNAAKKSIRFINQLGVRSSLVVIDEAHQAVAQTYQLVLDALVVPYEKTALLGLTATPGRTWADINTDAQLAKFFAQQKVTLEIPGYDNPIDYLVEEQYLAQANYRSLFYESGIELSPQDLNRINTELDIPQYILHWLAEDEQRNLRIILELEALAQHHQRIIVFSTSVEHAQLITSILRLRGFNADAVTGNTPKSERERIIQNFKDHQPQTKILCNYGVLTTGFDAPKTSAAVIARPTKSLVLYSQMVGRAIRGLKAGGNATAEIVTVVDSQLPGFGSVASAFHNWEDVWRKNP